MGIRWAAEPAYPQTRDELEHYCKRFVEVLQQNLGDRLSYVLLCGSWARGEARPPESDADITVIVDTVDDAVSEGLQQSWIQANMGCANVYGADEVSSMSREALEMYTTNAIVLWGTNPFPLPTRRDFADDLARIAETIARDARILEFYHWLTPEERMQIVRLLLSKHYLLWALKNVAALRSGSFPKDAAELRLKLVGSPEEAFVHWAESLTEVTYSEHPAELGRRLSLLARDWLREALLARSSS